MNDVQIAPTEKVARLVFEGLYGIKPNKAKHGYDDLERAWANAFGKDIGEVLISEVVTDDFDGLEIRAMVRSTKFNLRGYRWVVVQTDNPFDEDGEPNESGESDVWSLEEIIANLKAQSALYV
jgi:hypothetical protein